MFKVGDLVQIRAAHQNMYGIKLVMKSAVYNGLHDRFAERDGVGSITFLDTSIMKTPYACYIKHLELTVIEGDDDDDCI